MVYAALVFVGGFFVYGVVAVHIRSLIRSQTFQHALNIYILTISVFTFYQNLLGFEVV